jgi:hypothetical protein
MARIHFQSNTDSLIADDSFVRGLLLAAMADESNDDIEPETDTRIPIGPPDV